MLQQRQLHEGPCGLGKPAWVPPRCAEAGHDAQHRHRWRRGLALEHRADVWVVRMHAAACVILASTVQCLPRLTCAYVCLPGWMHRVHTCSLPTGRSCSTRAPLAKSTSSSRSCRSTRRSMWPCPTPKGPPFRFGGPFGGRTASTGPSQWHPI